MAKVTQSCLSEIMLVQQYDVSLIFVNELDSAGAFYFCEPTVRPIFDFL